jgi:hypothetical protein
MIGKAANVSKQDFQYIRLMLQKVMNVLTQIRDVPE